MKLTRGWVFVGSIVLVIAAFVGAAGVLESDHESDSKEKIKAFKTALDNYLALIVNGESTRSTAVPASVPSKPLTPVFDPSKPYEIVGETNDPIEQARFNVYSFQRRSQAGEKISKEDFFKPAAQGGTLEYWMPEGQKRYTAEIAHSLSPSDMTFHEAALHRLEQSVDDLSYSNKKKASYIIISAVRKTSVSNLIEDTPGRRIGFALEGIFLGLLGGMVAIALIYGIWYFLIERLKDISQAVRGQS